MDTKPRLTIWQQATLTMAKKAHYKALRHGRVPMHKVYSARDVALLEAHGWRVHTHTQPSYVAKESWVLTPA